jgi:hypothetical protein
MMALSREHPDLMQGLAEKGVKLYRLPGGFVRIPPHAD